MRKMLPAARRVLGNAHDHTLRMRLVYADTLYCAAAATLDDVREAVAIFEDTARIARRVLGGAHPTTADAERDLIASRSVLRSREAGHRVVFERHK